MNEPFANFYRPKKLEDVVGQSHLLNKDAVFYQTINSKKVPNMIFYGPPGIGKTTVAEIIAHNTDMKLYKLNGTTAKLDDVKAITDELNSLLTTNKILLYLDEIQYFNKKQQQTLLDFIENGSITLIASTTENPMFYI
ncbi:MAG: AAA family ATPase, partial [Bacilli bacterium]|nr:AAA family ATPase [Bacilli bacterium]